MTDDKPKIVPILIDQQKDFILASGNLAVPVTGDTYKSDTIKKLMGKYDYKKIFEDLPEKNLNKIDHITIIRPEMSGSMMGACEDKLEKYKIPDYILHETSHTMIGEKTGKADTTTEIFNRLGAIVESYRISREQGAVLADNFQQGAAAPVQVRRPISLRAGCPVT